MVSEFWCEKGWKIVPHASTTSSRLLDLLLSDRNPGIFPLSPFCCWATSESMDDMARVTITWASGVYLANAWRNSGTWRTNSMGITRWPRQSKSFVCGKWSEKLVLMDVADIKDLMNQCLLLYVKKYSQLFLAPWRFSFWKSVKLFFTTDSQETVGNCCCENILYIL